MSVTDDPAVPAPPVQTPITAASTSWWSALELSASSIYHRVLSFETNVSAWVEQAEANPNIKALLSEAVTFFESMVGVSPAVVNTVEAILAMLGKIAASDASIQSGQSPSTVVQPAIPAAPSAPAVSEGTKA
jgi:hypothetical protein